MSSKSSEDTHTSSIVLLPPVASARWDDGQLSIVRCVVCLNAPAHVGVQALRTAGVAILDAVEAACGQRPVLRGADMEPPAGFVIISLQLDEAAGVPGIDGYLLDVTARGARLRARCAAGVYYGAMTLCQLIKQRGVEVPLCSIQDHADMKIRGSYLDCTRGKVPRLDTLKAAVQQLSSFKVNHVQLYVEHTFEWFAVSNATGGTDPLTAEDLMELDAYARSVYVDLVPSVASFGHLYEVLRRSRWHHLNELELDAAHPEPYSWHERQAHHTLDPSNPASLELVKRMFDEILPCFSSQYVNICCDETFDLGKGRNVGKSVPELYVSFLCSVCDLVAARGKTPMYWGDILLDHVELVSRLPRDSVVLNWDYSASLSRDSCKAFADAGLRFLGCPGTQGWNQFHNLVQDGWDNITRMAAQVHAHHGEGLLNTDWGDYGHVNSWGCSLHGLVTGAAAAWNHALGDVMPREAFDSAFSLLVLGDTSGRVGSLVRAASAVPQLGWRALALWVDDSKEVEAELGSSRDAATKYPTRAARGMPLDTLAAAYRALRDAQLNVQCLRGKCEDKVSVDDIATGLWGQSLVQAAIHELIRLGPGNGGTPSGGEVPSLPVIADDLRRFEAALSKQWLARCKLAEYWRVRSQLVRIADALDNAHHVMNKK